MLECDSARLLLESEKLPEPASAVQQMLSAYGGAVREQEGPTGPRFRCRSSPTREGEKWGRCESPVSRCTRALAQRFLR